MLRDEKGTVIMTCKIITGKDNYDLLDKTHRKIGNEWPEFMLHDPTANLLDDCYTDLPDFQFVLVDDDDVNTPLALGNSIPLEWNDKVENLPDDGWDWALQKGIKDFKSGNKTNLLCALQIVVFGDNRGKGISTYAVEGMKQIGRDHGLTQLIAPVRPSRKSEFPELPMDEYILKSNGLGFPYDPWLRVHVKIGAKIIKPCHHAMRITGTIAEWENWTGIKFDESGKYVIPGALVPVEIDLENDLGTYVEPNVWMVHEL